MQDNINIYNFNSIDFENNYLNSIESDCYPGQKRPKFKSNEKMKLNTNDIYSEKEFFFNCSNNEQKVSILNSIRNNKKFSHRRRSRNYKIKINLKKTTKNSKISTDTNNNIFKNKNLSNKSQINAVKYINSIINNKKAFKIKESMIKNINNNLYINNTYSKSTYEFSTLFKDYNKSSLYKNKEEKIIISPNQKSKLLPIKTNKSSFWKISVNSINSNNSNKENIISSYVSSNKKNSYIKRIGKNNSIIHKNKSEKNPYKYICAKNLKRNINNKCLNSSEYLGIKTKTFFLNKNLKKENINKSPKKIKNINSFNEIEGESNVNPKEKKIKEYSSKKGPSSIGDECKAYKRLKNKMKSFNKKNEVRSMFLSKEKLIKN